MAEVVDERLPLSWIYVAPMQHKVLTNMYLELESGECSFMAQRCVTVSHNRQPRNARPRKQSQVTGLPGVTPTT
jgi:hypothetical protein